MKTKIRILFFTPYASRTGSEVMLWYILKHFDRTRFEIGIVSFGKGDLMKEVPEDVEAIYIPNTYSVSQKIAFHLGWNPTEKGIVRVSKQFKADLWYINTIMLPQVLVQAKKLNMPCITHVHELGHMFAYISQKNFKDIIDNSDLLIGCSDTVCQTLSDSGGRNIEKLYSFVDLNLVKSNNSSVKKIRKQLGALKNDFLWIMSGTTSERKGFDLLPDIAEKLPADGTLHLIWVGRLVDDGMVYWIRKRCEKIKNLKIHFIGAQHQEYYNYLAAADGFMMTSRQEPFGLVMVEASWLGKPIVSFKSGGPEEFITEATGTLVESFDIKAFVAAMENWRINISEFNKDLAQQNCLPFGTEIGMQNWNTIIENFYENRT